VGYSSLEPTPKNRGRDLKIKLVLTQRGGKEKKMTDYVIVTQPPMMWWVLYKIENKTQYLPHEVTIQMEGHRTKTESHEEQRKMSCVPAWFCILEETW